MIVLVTGSSRAGECADAIAQSVHAEVRTANSIAMLTQILHEGGVDAIVIDDAFQHVEGHVDGVVHGQRGEAAMPIHVNLSLHSAARVAQEVSRGLERVANERLLVRRFLADEFRNELRSDVTAILLTAGLALRDEELKAAEREKWQEVRNAADRMRYRLEGMLRPEAVGVSGQRRTSGRGTMRVVRRSRSGV